MQCNERYRYVMKSGVLLVVGFGQLNAAEAHIHHAFLAVDRSGPSRVAVRLPAYVATIGSIVFGVEIVLVIELLHRYSHVLPVCLAVVLPAHLDESSIVIVSERDRVLGLPRKRVMISI